MSRMAGTRREKIMLEARASNILYRDRFDAHKRRLVNR